MEQVPFVAFPPPPPPPQPAAPDDVPSGAATLLVKHLPDAMPVETLKRLFSHYGASDIRPCDAGRMKNCAFVNFQDEAQAARAQSQLHRLRFLGKILAVERAKPYTPKTITKQQSENFVTVGGACPQPAEPQKLPSYGTHGMSGTGLRSEPIAPSLGLDYPFPPHLEYAYPPPDGNILTNIVNALIAVPRFYTQVLHLMNKMNLPAPFRPALPTPPLPPPPPEPAAPPIPGRDLSSDESELESSEETVTAGKDEKKGRNKRTASTEVALDDVKATPLVPKERPILKKKRPILQINISSKGQPKEQIISTDPEASAHDQQEETENITEDATRSRNTATREELIAGRLPASELFALPVFKNYTRGIPTSVLYIKNLAKDVTQDDLFFIFGAVFESSEDVKANLGIKLMQEGRMRGQAFVTFPSVGMAEDALNTVHGYVLKGKPMVVQFGRNPAAAKPNQS